MSKGPRKAKATKKQKNKLLDTFTVRCPECNKKHTKDLPSDGGYSGFAFECCEADGDEMEDVLESVEISDEERKKGKPDWRVKGKRKKRHVFIAEL